MKSALFVIAQTLFRFFFVCRIENEVKKYYLKYTPFHFDISMRKRYEEKYGDIKVVQNRIVVDNYMGKGYGCNGKYVTEELLKTPDKYDIYWIVDDPEKRKGQFPEGIKLVRHLSEEAKLAYASAKVWLCNYHMVPYIEKWVFKKPEQAYIQTWHGSLGIKKIERESKVIQEKMTNWLEMAKINSLMTDYWISNSTFESNVYKSAFWNPKQILLYGHARNDIFFHERDKVEKKVKQALKIRDEEQIVLYVPTHRDEETRKNMELLDFERLRKAVQERFGGKWKVVVRLHPRTEPGALGENKPGIISATAYPDIQELLMASDVVITDYSSCIFDFLLTGRPGFFFVTDREEYTDMRGLYYPLTDTPFPVAENNQSLEKNILTFNKEEYAVKVKEFLREKGCMDDGHAAERIHKLIDEIIQGTHGSGFKKC